ncbi:MAG: hypothetical protein MR943_06835 [Lachnobacterium sp.]|nr:hypothetical protein [Lachnobacterium sp.]
MKNTALKGLFFAILSVVCITATSIPVNATTTTPTEASSSETTTRSITTARKTHLNGYTKKMDEKYFSKSAFFKDLNSLPSVSLGETTIHVDSITSNTKYAYYDYYEEVPIYESYFKFKAPKTGKYIFTANNLIGTSTDSVCTLGNLCITTPESRKKKYALSSDKISNYETIYNFDSLYENNYLLNLKNLADQFIEQHPDYKSFVEKDYDNRTYFAYARPTDRIQFKATLKKGKTYVFIVSSSSLTSFGEPYPDDIVRLNSRSCLYRGVYKEAHTFDFNIQYKK